MCIKHLHSIENFNLSTSAHILRIMFTSERMLSSILIQWVWMVFLYEPRNVIASSHLSTPRINYTKSEIR